MLVATIALWHWAVILAAFDYDLKHILGTQNVIADAHSRLPLPRLKNIGGVNTVYNIIYPLKLGCFSIQSRDVSKATQTDPVSPKVLCLVKFRWPEDMDDERPKLYWSKRWKLTVAQDCSNMGSSRSHRLIFQWILLQKCSVLHKDSWKPYQLREKNSNECLFLWFFLLFL